MSSKSEVTDWKKKFVKLVEWANDRKIKWKKDKFQRWGLREREKKIKGKWRWEKYWKEKKSRKERMKENRIVTIKIYENKAAKMQQE